MSPRSHGLGLLLWGKTVLSRPAKEGGPALSKTPGTSGWRTDQRLVSLPHGWWSLVVEDPRSRAEIMLFGSHVVDRKAGATDLARRLIGTGDPKALRMLLSVAANGVEHPLVRGQAYRAALIIAGRRRERGTGTDASAGLGVGAGEPARPYAYSGDASREAAAALAAAPGAPSFSDFLPPQPDDPSPEEAALIIRRLQEELFPSRTGLRENPRSSPDTAVNRALDSLFSEPDAAGRSEGASDLGVLLGGTGDTTVLRALLSVVGNTCEDRSVRDAARAAIFAIAGNRRGERLTAGRSSSESGDPDEWRLIRRLQEELFGGQSSYGQSEWLFTYGNVTAKLRERIPEVGEPAGCSDGDLPQVVFDHLYRLVMEAADPAVTTTGGTGEDLLERALGFIEDAVLSHDSHVVSVVAVSFMERLSARGPCGNPARAGDESVRAYVASRLRPASARLLREVDGWWARFGHWTRSHRRG